MRWSDNLDAIGKFYSVSTSPEMALGRNDPAQLTRAVACAFEIKAVTGRLRMRQGPFDRRGKGLRIEIRFRHYLGQVPGLEFRGAHRLFGLAGERRAFSAASAPTCVTSTAVLWMRGGLWMWDHACERTCGSLCDRR